MKPAFASNHVAALLILASLAVWALTEVRTAFRRRTEAHNRDRGSLYALRASVLIGALLAAVALNVRVTAFPFTPIIAAFTLAMLWAGIALRWWSLHALGRYFTFPIMISADQPVIATGPYRFLRHPSYLGLLLVFGGLGMPYGNWLSVLALVLTSLAGLVNRSTQRRQRCRKRSERRIRITQWAASPSSPSSGNGTSDPLQTLFIVDV